MKWKKLFPYLINGMQGPSKFQDWFTEGISVDDAFWVSTILL